MTIFSKNVDKASRYIVTAGLLLCLVLLAPHMAFAYDDSGAGKETTYHGDVGASSASSNSGYSTTNGE